MSTRTPRQGPNDAGHPAGDRVALDAAEQLRYARHLVLPEVGVEGQERLKAARVLVVGAGGLGAPVGMYLAAAGIGRLGLVDFDRVDTSNLQRQVTYSSDDVGRPKVEATRQRLQGINPHVELDLHAVRLTSDNALEIFADYDVVVDGTDNFATRYLVNDACVLLGKPNVYGSIFRFEGQASVFWSGHGPCYRCLFPEPPDPGVVPDCAEGGVLGVLPGVIGTLQATEALKIVLGIGEPLLGRLLLYDALAQRTRTLQLHRDPACAVCGDDPSIRTLIDYEAFCGSRADAPSHEETSMQEMSATQLHEKLEKGESPVILDVREPFEWDICNLQAQGAQLVPLNSLPARLAELSPDAEIVVVCKTGVRSAHATRFLMQEGFGRVANLVGGMHAWAREVDPSMPLY